jgi:hypothetical protein
MKLFRCFKVRHMTDTVELHQLCTWDKPSGGFAQQGKVTKWPNNFR